MDSRILIMGGHHPALSLAEIELLHGLADRRVVFIGDDLLRPGPAMLYKGQSVGKTDRLVEQVRHILDFSEMPAPPRAEGRRKGVARLLLDGSDHLKPGASTFRPTGNRRARRRAAKAGGR